MTTKTFENNQLKLNLNESKTQKSFNMPLITTGFSSTKRKMLTKNFLSTMTNFRNPSQFEEKGPLRLNEISSRSESRNKITRFNYSNQNITPSGTVNNFNYVSMMKEKQTSTSINELKSSSNNFNKSGILISPPKAKTINIINKPTSTSYKPFHPLSTRTKYPLIKNNQSESINIMNIISNHHNTPLNIQVLNTVFPNYDSAKTSLKSMNYIRGYGVNTYQGIIRNYNEDRVSIILNVLKPPLYKGDYWPKCSFFAIYDGHGGNICSDYLRDNLHHFIIKDPQFPLNPKEAIRKGFQVAENDFLKNYALDAYGQLADCSGSCAIVCLVVDDVIYIANVGDSRAAMSSNLGTIITTLSEDHKPNDEKETKRINDAGGKIYQTQVPHFNNLSSGPKKSINNNQVLLGPFRIFPGRLSVSRAFGDIEAKSPKFGGMPNVLISTPDIVTIKVTNDMDFIVLGCDGIFDQMTTKEVIDSIWITTKESKTKNIHKQCGVGVDMVMKTSLVRRSLDNVTVVIIAFSNFEKLFIREESSKEPKTKDTNASNDYIITNTNSTFDEGEQTSNKMFKTFKTSNEQNSKVYFHKKLSEDLKLSLQDKKSMIVNNKSNEDKQEINITFNNNNSQNNYKKKVDNSEKFKEAPLNLTNLSDKKFHISENRKILIKGINYNTNDSNDPNINMFFSNKPKLQTSETIIEKYNTNSESTKIKRTFPDFLKLNTQLQISKKKSN